MRLNRFLAILISFLFCREALSQCGDSCSALASYYLWPGTNLTFIAAMFSTTVANILSYNPQITDPDVIQMDSRINVPFSCGCVGSGSFMGGEFIYRVRSGDFYERIAARYYSNLTTVDMLTKLNSYPPTNVPADAQLNVVVNCTCGNKRVSRSYGLFITYPLRSGQTLSALAGEFSLDQKLLQDYNPGADFSRGSGLVFVPGKDQNGTFPPLKLSSSGISGGAIAGICIGVIAVLIVSAACFYFFVYKKKRVEEETFLQNDHHVESGHGESVSIAASASPRLKGITVDKSVEFTFEELSTATNNFDISYKIGQGGFGAVYYAELRGEKAGIKKMDMQASKEFLAELKVLTRVHHVNLVRLIGYCVEGSLFLVYEYIDNGNLSQHLRGRASELTEPLPWTTRVQIALDSARGLEYIHEHTVEVYIHRDIKSANILIDKNFRAKVADFGLTKLTKVDSASLQTRLVGTYGYMAPEYAQYGDASPKIDVYAFGVVLYELISAKEAIVKATDVSTESKGLVALFEDALKQTNETDGLKNLVDPRLGEDYPLDSVSKVAHLARACTHENPQLRPTMRSIVVALMTLSSSTEDWDIGAFYENQGLVHLMSGR